MPGLGFVGELGAWSKFYNCFYFNISSTFFLDSTSLATHFASASSTDLLAFASSTNLLASISSTNFLDLDSYSFLFWRETYCTMHSCSFFLFASSTFLL
jgi:hypothetical protein